VADDDDDGLCSAYCIGDVKNGTVVPDGNNLILLPSGLIEKLLLR
jgi:hypothetical protein